MAHSRRTAFETGGAPTTIEALADIGQALARRALWLAMAWQDIRQRYRGSMLGPFWVTINMGIMVGMLSLIYGRLFDTDERQYLPFLMFVVADRYIKQTRLPVTLFAFRLLARNLIVLAHNFVVYVVVAAAVGLNPGWTALLAIPGLALGAFCLFWIGLLFAMLGARFRDFPQIVNSVIQVLFYITPILWQPQQLAGRRYLLVDFNPVYYFIEIVRAPLMGHAPPAGYWKVTILIALAITAIVFPLFRRFRGRVAYWV